MNKILVKLKIAVAMGSVLQVLACVTMVFQAKNVKILIPVKMLGAKTEEVVTDKVDVSVRMDL